MSRIHNGDDLGATMKNAKMEPGHPVARGNLSATDHKNLEAYAGHVLDAYHDGTIKRADAVLEIAELIGAVDSGDLGTFRNIVMAGRKRLASL